MNKNELEYQKLVLKSQDHAKVIDFMLRLATLATVTGVVYIVVNGLVTMVSHKADSLQALATVIEKINLNSLLAYLVAVGTTGGYFYERKGKQNAYKRMGELRAKLENKDPYAPSSDLDHNGHTPN